MPLTDELKALLGDKATEDTLVEMLAPEATTYLTSKGNIIRTKDQDDSFVKSKVETEIKDSISNIHKKYDDDIFELTGERKKPTEKTYEFLKRKVAELKASAKPGEGVDKDQLKALQEQLRLANEEKDKTATEMQEKYFKKVAASHIASAFDQVSIAIPAHLVTDAEKQAFIADQKRMLKLDFASKYTVKEDTEGNIVFYDGDKLKSSTTDGKPLSVNDIIAENYSAHFSKEAKKQNGGGTGGSGGGAATFTTKEDVRAHLLANGYDESTAAYLNANLKLRQEHGIIS